MTPQKATQKTELSYQDKQFIYQLEKEGFKIPDIYHMTLFDIEAICDLLLPDSKPTIVRNARFQADIEKTGIHWINRPEPSKSPTATMTVEERKNKIRKNMKGKTLGDIAKTLKRRNRK